MNFQGLVNCAVLFLKMLIKDNFFFCATPRGSISLSLSPISDKLIRQRTAMGRIIIFCSTYDEVTSIYYFFKKTLVINFTEPPGAPDLPQYRHIDMYTHCTHEL